jgi:hypothetical protein
MDEIKFIDLFRRYLILTTQNQIVKRYYWVKKKTKVIFVNKKSIMLTQNIV